MKKPATYDTPLLPGNRYHIYNRGNNFQATFREPRDCASFLSKWPEFIYPVAKTFAYHLLPNHFHAVIEIREQPLVQRLDRAASATADSATPNWVSRAFNSFFISYSRTMQNRHGHHGAVFHSPFKRKMVGDDLQLEYLIAYVHYNLHKHGFFNGPLASCRHSSYKSLISESPTLLERDWLLDYFGGRDKFIAYHDFIAPCFDLMPGWEP